jgi:hypothetical protein
MNTRILTAVLLLVAVLTPASESAPLISNVELAAFGRFSTQLQPVKADADLKSGPPGRQTAAEVLVIADGVTAMPFPNVPTSQTRPFASSSANGAGEFGIGVNGFFFQNSLPPHQLRASGSFTQTILNVSESRQEAQAGFFIPAPTIRFFGVGDSTFPPGADPARDAMATAVIDIVGTVTLANGATREFPLVDYGLQVLRAPPSTVLFPFPRRDGVGKVTRFDEPDGSFGFLLPDLAGKFSILLDPGDSVQYVTTYVAEASTGFGETGVFAAIGDPFDISTGGGRIDIEVGPGAAIPEPGTLGTFGVGLVLVGISARRGRRAQAGAP